MVTESAADFVIGMSLGDDTVTVLLKVTKYLRGTRTHGPQRPGTFKYALSKASDVQMPKVEINIPEHLEMQIAQMVEQGEFLNREEAIEDLLSTGMKAYKTSGPMDDNEPGFEDDGMMGHEDEYVF
jgi:hypothetical protein